ncbi:MAG: gamma-glutamyl-gamma-aminobutyrate hydrolase family protein [Clostridia bacterium]|nr:gamma-glutamyl-gamma-aminobutyrate hydrolase family protein [Clostridia bacterium]
MSSFYCQLDYEHVPYLSPCGTKNGNIANNGCGVCSSSMIAENLAGMDLPPERCAKLCKAAGARETFGTNLFVFAPYLAQYTGLRYTVEWDAGKVLRFLQEKRGMVIANVRGDRPADGYLGVFSDSGHYIVLAGAEGNTVRVWDPMYRPGSDRFEIHGRHGKVQLSGTDAYADFSHVEQDCLDRPYFLYEKTDGKYAAPLIGILCGFINEETTQYVYRAYTQPVLKAGGIPVLLSLDTPDELMEETLSRMDGLLITGGPDVDPALYGQQPIPELGSVSAARDRMEIAAVKVFRRLNRPILGICRGIQSMAVALGGTLYQDIPAQYPGNVDHYPCREGWGIPHAHTVTVESGTRLEAISGGGTWFVNSYHHQAVNRLPEGARVAARSDDGLIEAFEMPEGALCLGVQWHPERLYEEDEHAFALFRELVFAARARMIDQGEGQK